MLDEILASWADPLFFYFPVLTTLVSVVSFVLFATPLTWLAWADPASLRRWRIQRPRPKAMQKHLRPAITSWVVNNLVMTGLVVLVWPLLRHTGVHTGPLPALWEIVLEVVLFIVLDDFLYYWMHRTLHSDRLFPLIHLKHHSVATPFAWTGHYMTATEFVLTGTLALAGPVLLGVHVVTLWVWIVWRQWEAAEGHCGYSFPTSPSKMFFLGYDGVEYHDFHHSKTHGNYAGFLGYLDGIFGSYAKGYKEHLAARRGGAQPAAPWRDGEEGGDETD